MERFNNRSYWNRRYTTNHPEGSGIGSRGIHAWTKHIALAWAVALTQPDQILDIGCGDMVVSQVLPATCYTGIDISEVIIARNREQFPTYTFKMGDFLDLDLESSDLVVALDILIHQPSADVYRQCVQKLVGLARKGGIVSAFERLPVAYFDSTTFFYESIVATLTNAGAKQVVKLGEYRETGLYLFLKEPSLIPDLDRLSQFLHFDDLIAQVKHQAEQVGSLEHDKTTLIDYHHQVLTHLTSEYGLLLRDLRSTYLNIQESHRKEIVALQSQSDEAVLQVEAKVALLHDDYKNQLAALEQNFTHSLHQPDWVAGRIPWRILVSALWSKLTRRKEPNL
jgi:SAM-dependent methyltransferase